MTRNRKAAVKSGCRSTLGSGLRNSEQARRRLARACGIVAVSSGTLFTCKPARAANTLHSIAAGATGSVSAPSPAYTAGGAPTGSTAGDILVDQAASSPGAFTLTLDGNVTIGTIKLNNSGNHTGTFTSDGTHVFTLDNIGGNVTNILGNTNASIGQNANLGVLTVNPDIIAANSNLDIGLTAAGSVTIGGNITATTATSLNLRNNNNSGASGNAVVLIAGGIGATGSDINILNDGTGTSTKSGNAVNLNGAIGGAAGTGATITISNTFAGTSGAGFNISGNLAASVTTVTQNTTTSTMNLSGTNTNFAGAVNVSAGTLKMGSTAALNSANTVSVGTGGTFDIAAQAETIAGLNNISGAGGTVTNSSTSAALTLAGSGNYSFGGNLTATNLGVIVNVGGTQTISGANTYAGVTTVNAGTLAISGGGTLGSGSALTMGGGTLDLGGTSQTVGAVNITTAASTGNTIQNGNLTGTSYAASNTTGTAVVTANLLANGSAGLTKSGAGLVTLSGISTYTGTTTLNSGTLALRGSTGAGVNVLGATAVTVNTGATLQINGNVTIGNSTAGTLTIAGTLATAPILSLVDGTINTLTLSNSSGTTFTIGSGSSTKNSTLNMEVGSSSDEIVLTGAAKASVNNAGTPISVNITGLGNLTGGNQTLISDPGITTGNSNFPNAFKLISTTGNFNGYNVGLAGNSTVLTLTEGANASPTTAYFYGGAAGGGGTTAFNSFVGGNTNTSNFSTDSAGTINGNGSIGNTTNVYLAASNLTTAQGVTLGQNYTVNSLNFTGNKTVTTPVATTIGAGNTLTINASTGYTDAQSPTATYLAGVGLVVQPGAAASTINASIALGNSQTWEVDNAATNALTINGNISGASKALTKTGSGVIVLAGSSSYSGGTTISAGTIRANNTSGNATGTGSVTVAAGGSNYGGARLGGNGTVGGMVTLGVTNVTTKQGGIITAGADDATAGKLTTGAETWNGGGVYQWKINNAGTGVTGGPAKISAQTGGSSTTWDDLAVSGALTVGSSGSPISVANGNAFTIQLSSLTGNQTTPTATTGFDATKSFSWIIGTVSSISLNGAAPLSTTTNFDTKLVTGVNTDLFALDTSGFNLGTISNALPSGAYGFELDAIGTGSGDNIVLSYDATPEPGTAMLVLGGALPLLMGRRRRRTTDHKAGC